MHFKFLPESNELLVSAQVRKKSKEDIDLTAVSIPVKNIVANSIILASGKQIKRDAPAGKYQASIRGANRPSPSMAVVEAKYASFYAFTIGPPYSSSNIVIDHNQAVDDMTLGTLFPEGSRGPRPAEHDKDEMSSAVWRIGYCNNWFQAVKRYKKLFEEQSGVKKLSQNNCPWVRKIHAMASAGQNLTDPKLIEKYYKALAERFDPEKVLLFYWNGNNIIAFGDHRYLVKRNFPSPENIQVLKKHGFHWMGYHPYDLIPPPVYLENNLKALAKQGQLPENYVYTPDYGGAPEKFYDYIIPATDKEYADKNPNIPNLYIHPASKQFYEYFPLNFKNYCAFHKMDGAYLDTMGSQPLSHFSLENKIMDGVTWTEGVKRTMEKVHKENPELPMMGEVHEEYIVPYIFYCWGGSIDTNHPMRAALWGDYNWNLRGGVLSAELPSVNVNIDRAGNIIEDKWQTALCQMYTQNDLFHALPDFWKWPDGALAFFRGKDGVEFQYREMPFGKAYVKVVEKAKGREKEKYEIVLGEFENVSKSPFEKPVTIQDWCAYRSGSPIGLDPRRSYKFMDGKSKEDKPFIITGLPEKVFLNAIRESKDWTVIEFACSEGFKDIAQVEVEFKKDCLRVCGPFQTFEGPFKAGTKQVFNTMLPGGVVFVFGKTDPDKGSVRNGFIDSSGVIDWLGMKNHFTGSYNKGQRVVAQTLDGVTRDAVSIGYHTHRGYTDKWVRLVEGASPVLKFSVGYPPHRTDSPTNTFHEKRVFKPVIFSVRINGFEVYRELVQNTQKWQDREIDLTAFAGRDVLITLSAERPEIKPYGASHLHMPALFGNVRIDNNPDSLEFKASENMKPENPIVSGFGKGAEFGDGWDKEQSDKQPENASVSLRDGVLYLDGIYYQSQYLMKKIDIVNPSAQCKLIQPFAGGMLPFNRGLGFVWADGSECFITGGGVDKKRFQLFVSCAGKGKYIKVDSKNLKLNDSNDFIFMVKISLTPSKVKFFYSLDGGTWQLALEAERPEKLKGAPEFVFTGNMKSDERYTGGRTTLFRISDFYLSESPKE